MKEMLIGASWPPRPPPTRVCVPATDAYFGQAALEVLELKHTLGSLCGLPYILSIDTGSVMDVENKSGAKWK